MMGSGYYSLRCIIVFWAAEETVLQISKRDRRSLACCPQEIVLVMGKGWTKQDDKQEGILEVKGVQK